MAGIIRNPIKYIAEFFTKNSYDPRSAIADGVFSRVNNIFAFSVADHITAVDNYWIVWGGTFDNIELTAGLQIFFKLFLTEYFTTAALEATENSFYIDTTNDICYLHLTKNPWQYGSAYASVYDNLNSTFGTAPKDETNLSDIRYGNVKVEPIMSIPSVNNKLNDIVSGIKTYNTFSVTVLNIDGRFDGVNIKQFFNTPCRLRKSTAENPTSISDFNIIQTGIIANVDVSMTEVQFEATDTLYMMQNQACKKFETRDYPNVPESNVNKNIPIAWGDILGAELFEVNKDTADPPTWCDYIAVDKNYITAVDDVFDSDGNSLTFSFDSTTGIIRVTEVDEDGEVIDADRANITGQANNLLGQVIIDTLSRSENLAYVDGIWDTDETDDYLSICAEVGFIFTGGTTRDLIEQVLKNDNAFLIQKNNGLLTIRQWGQIYDIHNVASWLITKKPSKNFLDAWKYFCSSVKVLYNKNHKLDSFGISYLDDSEEVESFRLYRRSYLATFETDLIDYEDVENFASRILERFADVKETLKIGVGVDTFDVNLLDMINLEVTINGREFSAYESWIVKETDPGQDQTSLDGTIAMEFYVLSYDGEYSELDGDLFEVS